MKSKFPLEHVVKYDTNEVWVNCNGNGQLSRYGVTAMVERYYPGYTGHCGSKEYLETLRNKLAKS